MDHESEKYIEGLANVKRLMMFEVENDRYEISKNQVYKFTASLSTSPIKSFLTDKLIRQSSAVKRLTEKLKDNKIYVDMTSNENQAMKQRIINEYGIKSREYGIMMGTMS
tara:strand:- start:6281 stop:6610 length:330 start_codon:yes stop_codon:yes gene_type:complete